MKDKTIKTLQELCKELNIKIEILSYGWILKLSKGDKIIYITAKFDINKSSSSKIADDKYATYEVLKSQNIPVIEHIMIFNSDKRNEYIKKQDALKIIDEQCEEQKKIVVKPNYGFQGKDVFLCDTKESAKEKVKYLLNKNTSISICPFYNVKNEYRTFYLNGKILLIYEKEKPYIIGNGKEDIKTLIKKLNLPNNDIVKSNLNKLNLNYIPKENEKIELSWKYNLSGGATAKVISKENANYKEIENLAKMAGKTLDMTFATIDIILTKDNELYVLEINSGVSTNRFEKIVKEGKEITKEIYKKVLIEILK